LDVAEAIGPNCEKKVIGIRPGEKIHEEMISASDSFFTYDLGKYYVIIPQSTIWNLNEFVLKFNAIKVKEGFSYNSLDNEKMENVESLRELIREHIDPNFKA
jgi:FlaA1/EpsC-like NDP-sugar epimerase